MNNTTMESLALPQDLYWDVKLETNSPPNCQLFSIFENLNGNTLDGEDYIANEILTVCGEELELKHDDIDFTQELIGEELVIQLYNLKEENFYSPSPLLENGLDSVVTNPTQVVKVQSPVDINQFGFANHGASVFTSLTPPSSPPQIVASSIPHALELSAATTAAATNLPIAINDVLQNPTVSEPTPTSPVPVQNQFVFTNWNNHHSTTNTASVNISSPASSTNTNYDIVLNTQIIDDILKTAANEFFEESESQSSVSGRSTVDYTSTDDEWLPSSGSCSPSQIVSTETLIDSSGNSAGKKRTRPYGRGVEDRKKRKKEQNKNAATRYRQKKKLEMELIQMEEQKLTQRHEELKRQLNEHKREAKYLRRLIREFYAKKQ